MSFQNNNRFQLNNNEIYLINMLNNMYINNNRLINNLVSNNNEIRSMIQNIIHQNIQNNRNTRNQRSQRNNNERQPYFTHSNSTTDPYSSILLSLLFPDETSYTIDYVQPMQEENFMEPVPIFPTQEQIENATSSLLYREIENPLNHSCPISLEPFHQNDTVTIIKYCGHIFKPAEIQAWFQNNVRCPICRYDIRSFSTTTNTTNTSNTINATNRNTNENPRRQLRSNNLERNNDNSRRQPVRILQRGETFSNSLFSDDLFNSLWRTTFIRDVSSNHL